MLYKQTGMNLLERISRRCSAGGFVIWLLDNYLEEHGDRMSRSDLKVFKKSAEIIAGLEMDSYFLEDALGAEAAAHASERRVNIQQEIELRSLREERDLLKRQVESLRLFLDSGEIVVDGVDEETKGSSG